MRGQWLGGSRRARRSMVCASRPLRLGGSLRLGSPSRSPGHFARSYSRAARVPGGSGTRPPGAFASARACARGTGSLHQGPRRPGPSAQACAYLTGSLSLPAAARGAGRTSANVNPSGGRSDLGKCEPGRPLPVALPGCACHHPAGRPGPRSAGAPIPGGWHGKLWRFNMATLPDAPRKDRDLDASSRLIRITVLA